MLKRISTTIFLILLFILYGCSPSTTNKQEPVEKPKYLWFDATANFERFATIDSIKYYLDKTKEVGFNQIVVDVRPTHGDVLYKSNILAPLIEHNGHKVERDWDYLQVFIDEAKKRDLKVTVSATIYPIGRQISKTGEAYRTNKWDDRTSYAYKKDGSIKSIKEDTARVAVFASPSMKENQEYALSFLEELLTKYDFDGLALDYCRYANIENDFSPQARQAFEEYIGQKVKNFPSDIFKWNEDGSRVDGKYVQQWWEFRSMMIHNFIEKVKHKIADTQPKVKLEYWSASWINSLYTQGQNWASKSYDFKALGQDWASENYKNTGFAEHLDVFMCGAYLDSIRGKDNPESIEYGLERANTAIDGECEMYGCIYARNHEANMIDAVEVCLTQSEGLVVFDIIQVIQFDLWKDIKTAIDKFEADS